MIQELGSLSRQSQMELMYQGVVLSYLSEMTLKKIDRPSLDKWITGSQRRPVVPVV